MDLYEDSPGSSEHSTGSTLLSHSAGENLEHSLHQDIGTELKSIQIVDQKGVGGCDQGVLSNATLDQGRIINSYDNNKYKGISFLVTILLVNDVQTMINLWPLINLI